MRVVMTDLVLASVIDPYWTEGAELISNDEHNDFAEFARHSRGLFVRMFLRWWR